VRRGAVVRKLSPVPIKLGRISIGGTEVGSELNLARFQVAFVNTKDRLLTLLRQIENTRTALAIMLLAFDGDSREDFWFFTFRKRCSIGT
jgi:hypothetical protein